MSVEEIGNIMETSNFRLWLSNHDKQIRTDAIDEFVKAYERVISDECTKDCSHVEDDVDCLTCVANKLKEEK